LIVKGYPYEATVAGAERGNAIVVDEGETGGPMLEYGGRPFLFGCGERGPAGQDDVGLAG
jgi:hypothetical protein